MPHDLHHETDHDFTVYSHPESGHSYKVKLTLDVAQIPHHTVTIDISLPHQERPEPFRSLAPFGEVPVLVHRGTPLVQSNAILLYLAQYTQRFGAESSSRMQQVREWLFWESNRLGLSLPHLRFAQRFTPQAYPEGTLQWLRNRFDMDIARLAKELADGRRFILDDTPCVADFSLCGYLFWADQAALRLTTSVENWLQNIRALPGWTAPFDGLKPHDPS